MILGIDTATAPATAALVEEGQLVSEEVQPAQTQCGPLSPITNRVNHAEIILPGKAGGRVQRGYSGGARGDGSCGARRDFGRQGGCCREGSGHLASPPLP